jgi:ABC-type sugar transport system ATPase subunit
MDEPFLRLVNIKKSFPGVQALKGVTIEVDQGEVLAIVGANGAGKTTLMNILGGVVKADEGEIYIQGERVHIDTPLEAANHGIAFVHQEIAVMPTMSVAENMYITNFPTRLGFIDYRKMLENCSQVLKRLGCDIDPRTKIQDLSPGDRQLIEIARALLGKARILIFDEPTSSLTSREKARLFEVIESLKKEKVAIIYITHLLDEIFKVGDRVSVIRNGEVVGGGMVKDLTYSDLVHWMIGAKEISSYFRPRTAHIGDVILRVEGLSRQGVLENISFTLHKGEILGLWGLLGSGRTELVRAIVGLDPIDKGKIEVQTNGGSMKTVRPIETRKWIGIITENRREDGLLLPKSVKFNMSLANLRNLLRFWPIIDFKHEIELTKEFIGRLGIVVSNFEQPIEMLSGGNQQKVLVARWLERNPSIYFMDEPTRGLDIGAKAEIHNIIRTLADEGAGILLITSDIDEIISLSDRFLVIRNGHIVAEFPTGVSKDELMATAAGVA